MKKRKNLVITYVEIFIVIAILVAIIFGVIKIFFKEYNNEEYKTVKTNMLLIKGQTEVLAQKVEIKEKDAKYIGTKLEKENIDSTVQNLIDNKIIDIESKDSNYYCIDNNNLKELGLGNVTTDNYYIVDYKKNDVIYVNGIKDSEGNMVYKLSDMK